MRSLALVILACASTVALAAPRKKTPNKAPEPAPEPAPAPEPPPPPAESTPWAQGVPQETQDKASALYEEGNQLFAQQAHAPALAKYKEAIALWEHPLIRFNLAVTEIRLERVLEAADDLEKSLKYGDQPFKTKPDLYQQALDYQALLKGRVGYIEASCDQAGTRVMLDGKPWLNCPGTKHERVLAGEHVILGEKQGFLTSTTRVVVDGGETVQQKVNLVPLDSAVVLKYPYRRWIPWTTTAMGVAVALGGVGTWILGRDQMEDFEAEFATQCMNGCEPGLTDPSHRSLASLRDSAELKGQLGIGMMAIGGGVMATGIVLVILNRPKRVLPDVEVAPKAGGGVAAVGWRF